jgi:hypothetical protein
MPRLTECLVSIDLANALRDLADSMKIDVPRGDLGMRCPKCHKPVKPHRGDSPHFEHLARNPDCPVSDVR